MAGRKKGSTNEIEKNETIIQQPMEEVMHNSIMPYAEYVILERALPRVEDGLKPVQRRILYTMYELGLTPDKPHRKSARIVGDALGKYHPHGDTSVYDAMVRMAQGFNMRALLVDGHGNFGSIDGDSAAAMRYTEARLTPLSMELLRDLDKETVQFSLNFDDTLKEPDMLPGRFPNLLTNGASGIAVGLATNIPPHNLGEVIDGVIAQINDPDIELKELVKYIKGPDFPTGGMIIGGDEIIKAYETGKGKLIVRAKLDLENGANGKKLIVIKELPYQTNKANTLEKILKLSEEKKGVLSGIADIRDESDRNGMRAVIELKKEAEADKIINYLYKYSDLQITFGVNMVAIANGKPVLMGLKEINAHYIKHQKEVVTKRTRFDLEKAKAREHILEGLIIAIRNIDEVIAIIRSSKTPKDAKNRLMKTFQLSEIQAQAILDMRLQRLTGLEILNLEKEYRDIQKLIKKLEEILASEKKLFEVVKREMLEIKEKYADKRRTELIKDESEAEIKNEDIMIVENVVVTLSHEGYIKRIPTKSFNRSNKDIEAVEIHDKDFIEFVVDSSTDQKLLLFTDQGNCYQALCQSIPEGKWREKGSSIYTLMNGFAKEERVISLLSIKEFSENQFLNFYTQQGMIKKTSLPEYNSRKSRIQGCKLKKEDKLIFVELCNDKNSILLITKKGMSINITNDQINPMGRIASGVKGISLSPGDSVIFARQISLEGEVVVITDRGFGKRTLASDYDIQGRAGKGQKTFEFRKNYSNGRECIAAFYVKEPFIILCVQKNGEITKINTEDLPIENRLSKGKSIVMVVMDNIIQQVYRNYN